MSNCIFYIECQDGHATIEDCQLRNAGQTYPSHSPECYRCPNKITRAKAKSVLIKMLRERGNRDEITATKSEHWKRDKDGNNYCPSCKRIAEHIIRHDCFGGIYETTFLSNYCPNCGIKLTDEHVESYDETD